jgi:hypothetical protein
MEEKVRKLVAVLVAGSVSAVLVAGPALADKVTAWDGKDKITVGGKTFEVSGKRTKVTIKGAASTREALKVGMDCKVSAAAGAEAAAISCN